jgi:hypothetical protein
VAWILPSVDSTLDEDYEETVGSDQAAAPNQRVEVV